MRCAEPRWSREDVWEGRRARAPTVCPWVASSEGSLAKFSTPCLLRMVLSMQAPGREVQSCGQEMGCQSQSPFVFYRHTRKDLLLQLGLPPLAIHPLILMDTTMVLQTQPR